MRRCVTRSNSAALRSVPRTEAAYVLSPVLAHTAAGSSSNLPAYAAGTTLQQLRTPRAASLAGALFAVLFGVSASDAGARADVSTPAGGGDTRDAFRRWRRWGWRQNVDAHPDVVENLPVHTDIGPAHRG